MRRFALLLALVIALPGVTRGQETTGTISGRVTDAQGLAVPGVSVTISGAQGNKTATTDGEGRFSAPFLTPGKYDVKAELSGFKTVEQKGLTLALGQALDVPLKLQVGGVTETVQVVGTTDVINVNTTTTGANITSDLLERVPVGRDLGSTLYLAPGVSSSSTAGHANPSIAGGSGLDNQYVIDGVNVTNTGYGALGSYSIIFGSLGNATPYDFMQEVQVKTGGYEAEYRPGDRRRRKRHHEERIERPAGVGVRLLAARSARKRVDPVPVDERQRANGRHASVRCRC